MTRFAVHCLLVAALGSVAVAADWPHRNGPYRNNATTEIVKPWTEPLKPAWTMKLGEGYSSPTVAGGRVYLHHKLPDQDVEEVLALELTTGKPVWRFSYPHQPFESNVGNGPRGAPSIVLGKVYTYGITGILTCLDAATGRKIWQRSVLEEAGAPVMMFGATAGPLVEGNRLYIPIGAKGCALAAFDTATGEKIWQTLDDPPTSVGPIMFMPRVEGRGAVRHIVYLSTSGLFGVSPVDGKPLWEFPLTDLLPIGTLPPPTIVGDTLLAGSMPTGAVAMRIEDRDGTLTAKEIWRNPQVTCYFTQSLAVGDEVYINNATLIPAAEIALSCVDAKTGKELWRQPKVGTYQLNLIRTGDDKILALDDLNGDAILIEPNREKYTELCRSKVCKPTIISPALADGHMIFRDDEGVSCYKLP